MARSDDRASTSASSARAWSASPRRHATRPSRSRASSSEGSAASAARSAVSAFCRCPRSSRTRRGWPGSAAPGGSRSIGPARRHFRAVGLLDGALGRSSSADLGNAASPRSAQSSASLQRLSAWARPTITANQRRANGSARDRPSSAPRAPWPGTPGAVRTPARDRSRASSPCAASGRPRAVPAATRWSRRSRAGARPLPQRAQRVHLVPQGSLGNRRHSGDGAVAIARHVAPQGRRVVGREPGGRGLVRPADGTASDASRPTKAKARGRAHARELTPTWLATGREFSLSRIELCLDGVAASIRK